jgi:hypothetical protein
MSQFNIRSLREIPNSPNDKFVNTLAKRVSQFLNKEQTDKLENKEDIYSAGQDTESVVKFHSNLSSTKYFDFETEFYPPTEPDADKVKLWIKGDNIGNDLNDISGFNNHGVINGDPQLVDGTPFDYGIHTGGTKSVALRFNRPTSESVNEEYINVADHSSLDITSIATGFSIFIRFKIHSLAQQGGISRTLYEKTDDATPNNGYMAKVTSDGKFQVVFTLGGTETKKETGTGKIVAGTVYDVWITFAVSGSAVKVYINNVDETLSNSTGTVGWHATSSNTDLSIFRRGAGTTGGHTYGDLYDIMILKERIVSTAEVGYHYTNKWTTANIPYGQVMVSNYWATYTP